VISIWSRYTKPIEVALLKSHYLPITILLTSLLFRPNRSFNLLLTRYKSTIILQDIQSYFMEPKVQNRIFRINKKVPDVSIDGKVKIIFDRTT